MKTKLHKLTELLDRMNSELEDKEKETLAGWLSVEVDELEEAIQASSVLDKLLVVSEVKVKPVPGGQYRAQVVETEICTYGRNEGKEYRELRDSGYDSDSPEEAAIKSLKAIKAPIVLTEDFCLVEV